MSSAVCQRVRVVRVDAGEDGEMGGPPGGLGPAAATDEVVFDWGGEAFGHGVVGGRSGG